MILFNCYHEGVYELLINVVNIYWHWCFVDWFGLLLWVFHAMTASYVYVWVTYLWCSDRNIKYGHLQVWEILQAKDQRKWIINLTRKQLSSSSFQCDERSKCCKKDLIYVFPESIRILKRSRDVSVSHTQKWKRTVFYLYNSIWQHYFYLTCRCSWRKYWHNQRYPNHSISYNEFYKAC